MKKRLTQEGLKWIACAAMLLDHLGAAFFPGVGLRLIGRVAFPIYCFLLTEGVSHTRSPLRYGLRLGVGAVLSEVPFDLLIFGGITLRHQSVMVTLLLGFFMAEWMQRGKFQILPLLVCGGMAALLGSDYGFFGVMMIWVFVMTWNLPGRQWVQSLLLAAVCLGMGSAPVGVFGIRIPIELFALLALIPISLYSGEKRRHGKAAQWGFYLFYPGHLLILWLIRYMWKM